MMPRHFFGSLFLLGGLLAAPLPAQTAPKAAEARDDFVTEKGFGNRVFEIRHRDVGDLAAVLRPLGSGYRGATLSANRDFRTISVRDFPENIAAMDAAIKRLDVVEAPGPDVELRLWVLVASNGEQGAGKFPEDLKEAVGALKSTLNYKSYELAGSFQQRVRAGTRGIQGEGVTEVGTVLDGKLTRHTMQLEYKINELTLERSESGGASFRLDGFSLSLVGNGRSQLRTDVTVRDGEKVVVGTSTVRDRGLVVVVSGRLVR